MTTRPDNDTPTAEELGGNKWLADKLASMSKREQRLVRLEAIEAAAKKLMRFLRANTGTNADWPIEIKTDEEFGNLLAECFNKLQKALKE